MAKNSTPYMVLSDKKKNGILQAILTKLFGRGRQDNSIHRPVPMPTIDMWKQYQMRKGKNIPELT